MNSGPTDGRWRQFQLIAASVLFAASSGAVCAQDGYGMAANDNLPPSASSADRLHSGQIAVSPMPLRTSSALTPLRRIAEIRSATKIAPKDGTEPTGSSMTPRLRLDPALASTVASGARLSLPRGELNRAGIIRATAVQVRDGGFFLVGDYFDTEVQGFAAGDAVGRN